MEIIKAIDLKVIRIIESLPQNEIIDQFFLMITRLGDVGIIWILISFLLIFNKKYRKTGILMLIGIGVTSLVGGIFLKNLIRRPRPFIDFPDIKLIFTPNSIFSFPSGHTSSSVVSAYIYSKKVEPYKKIVWMIAILIGFSRVYLNVHYISDIIGGILLGLIIGAIILRLSNKFSHEYI